MSLLPVPEKRLCDSNKIHCLICIGRENCTQYDYEEFYLSDNLNDVKNVTINHGLPKIRIYDKIQNKMIYSGMSILKNDGIHIEFSNVIEDTSPIQMFGTNLLDKNNIEIFEGDIVSDGVFIYVIKYDFMNGFLKYFNEETSKLHNANFLEIVGNIYQTK